GRKRRESHRDFLFPGLRFFVAVARFGFVQVRFEGSDRTFGQRLRIGAEADWQDGADALDAVAFNDPAEYEVGDAEVGMSAGLLEELFGGSGVAFPWFALGFVFRAGE